ncbi:MFS transporter [Streptomyces sp. NPDC102274]|uniref:MFS transporter n=1 Tax=Streptomyces sp. NPDC102274 TaxID=3366151 RepID=UPI003806AA46
MVAQRSEPAREVPRPPPFPRRAGALVAGYAVSSYGNYLNLIALSLFTYEVTGSGLGLGLLMALRLFAGFLAGLAAGALAARVGRRRLMLIADVCQAAAMVVLALCVRSASEGLLVAVVIVLGAGNTFFTVALRSAVPVMVGSGARVRANGRLATARSLATVAGFASAAPVIGLAGHGAAFAVNAASFLVSAAVIFFLRLPTDEDPTDEDPTDKYEADKHRTDEATSLPQGSVQPNHVAVRRIWTAVPALLLGLILLRGVDALASSSHNVALPVVAALRAPQNPAAFMTQFWASWAVGTLVAHQLLKGRQASRMEGRWGVRALAGGTCAMSLCFVLAFTGIETPLLLMAIVCLAGIADGFTEIVYTSRLQAAPDRERSRLFGLSATAETCGFALGMVTAAAALDRWTALTVVGVFHGLAFCGAAVLLLISLNGRRKAGRKPA